MGRQVAGLNYPPTNKNTLIRALTEEWDKLPQQLLDNAVQKEERKEIKTHGKPRIAKCCKKSIEASDYTHSIIRQTNYFNKKKLVEETIALKLETTNHYY
ncbi:hypothetical protein TNCV_3673761 [Trichonephila clavipes]|nr:hypothetical protein TNCV_3673761 [Trichonephila clavipes]